MFSISINLNEEFECPNFKENILNDWEIIKSIYVDNYEGYDNENYNQNTSSDLDNISFKLNLKMEMEVDPDLIELIKAFKFSELLINSNTIGLPFWVNFDCDFLTKTLHLKFYLFWMKKHSAFYDTLQELLSTNLNQDSIFFSMIEDFKNFLKPPEKSLVINWLQQMKEELIIHKEKIPLDEFIFNTDKTKKKNLESEQQILYEEPEELESDNLFLLKARSHKILENSKQKQEKQVIEVSTKKPVDNGQYEQFINDGGLLGEIITDRGSSFQAHIIKISSFNDVSKYMKILKTNNKIFKATHNILAYRVKENLKNTKEKNSIVSKSKKHNQAGVDDVETNLTQGFDEDGEDGAGIRLLGILDKMKIYNVMVVVSRWFGGTLLGNDRFKHINDSAKNLINKNKDQFDYMI